MKNVLIKLNKIQTELKVPKGQMNKFGNYKYRSCEDILESTKPLLKEHKCIIALTDLIVVIGERYYVDATATIYDCESGESFGVDGFAREEENKKGMDSSQVTGATSSYARKYALNGLLAIDDTKDSDATNTHGKDDIKDTPLEETLAKITPLQAKTIKDLAEQTSSDINAIVKYAAEKSNTPVGSVDDFNTMHYAWASKALNKKLEDSKNE